ncbi:MAG: hypothetical protein QM689_04385 [Oscillospiraceae bacterium]
MFTITVADQTYELKTNLGTSFQIEEAFKMPLTEIFGKTDSAHVTELIKMLAIAGREDKNPGFRSALLNNWDYTDLQFTVQELLGRLMFSGTDEENERKIEKFPASEAQKNVFREMLGLPKKNISSTPSSSSEQPTASE